MQLTHSLEHNSCANLPLIILLFVSYRFVLYFVLSLSVSTELWLLWKTLAFLCKRFRLCNLCRGVTHTRTHITHCQADNLCANVHTRVCSQTWGSECVHLCRPVSKPSIRQIMIHHHNGALMAAVKIIFDRPALSWPLSFLFVFLSLSLLSLFFPTILSVTHSKIGRACNTSASDTTIPIKILPVKHLLAWHTVKRHIYFLGSHQLWPFLSLHSCIWPILGSFFSWWRSKPRRAGDSRRADAFISSRLSDTFYLYSRVFSGRRQRNGTAITFQVPANTGKRIGLLEQTEKMTASCKDN